MLSCSLKISPNTTFSSSVIFLEGKNNQIPSSELCSELRSLNWTLGEAKKKIHSLPQTNIWNSLSREWNGPIWKHLKVWSAWNRPFQCLALQTRPFNRKCPLTCLSSNPPPSTVNSLATCQGFLQTEVSLSIPPTFLCNTCTLQILFSPREF